MLRRPRALWGRLPRRARVLARNGNVTGAVQVGTDERHFPQALFRKKTELHGDESDDERRVDVAQVIRGKNVAAVLLYVLETFDRGANPRTPHEQARPGARDAV